MRPPAPFICAHATHPDWGMATALVLAQLHAALGTTPLQTPSTPQSKAQRKRTPPVKDSHRLALVYMTEGYAPHAAVVVERLQAALPAVRDWVGSVQMSIVASGVEYSHEPALAVMLLDIAPARYRVFNGLHPLSMPHADANPSAFHAQTALVHLDGQTPDIPELIAELAARTQTGHVFGGILSHRPETPPQQIAYAGDFASSMQPIVFQGGLSGVAFDDSVGIITRVTQGCTPVSTRHTVTKVEGPVVLGLDDRPALEVLLEDLSLELAQRHITIPKLRSTFVGLSRSSSATRHTKELGADVRVRHLIGLDIERQGIAIAAASETGDYLQFCERQTAAAQTDLVRICTEIREIVESLNEDHALTAPATRMLGAIYVSCTGRGGPYFGAPHAEMQVIQRALGDLPLIGFFASGEIAAQQLYAYTGVLTVFLDPPAPPQSRPPICA